MVAKLSTIMRKIRNGEKLHEEMISKSDTPYTY